MGSLAVFAGVCVANAAEASPPDGRKWELVSPVDKNGGDVLLYSSRVRASVSGSAVSYASLTGFGDVMGTSFTNEYIAQRGPAGWKTHAITPQQDPMNGAILFNGPGDAPYEGEFSSDLSRGVVRANAAPTTDSDVAGVQNLFVRTNLLTSGLGSFQLVTDSVAPVGQYLTTVNPEYRPAWAGASSDFSHVIFESSLNLTQDAIDAGLPTDLPKLYEWVQGTVRTVGILPPSEGGGLVAESHAGRGTFGLDQKYTAEAISDDGSRIFFSVPSTGQVYLREHGAATIRVSASEKDTPDPTPGVATFWTAARDGSRVFFSTTESLVDADEDTQEDLYHYDVGGPVGNRLTLVSVDQEPADGLSAVVRGVFGSSEDGEWVYFAATGQMAQGAPIPSNVSAPLVFAWNAGSIMYAGKLDSDPADLRENIGVDWFSRPKTSRVSADGHRFLFSTVESDQVPAQNHGACPESISGRCRELYLFNAEANGGAGSLRCVSCSPAGPATGDASMITQRNTGAALATQYLNRGLSDDGRWVFFTTPEALSADDRNRVDDVYRFDATDNTVQLISSGAAGSEGSFFLDASPSGRDVFFATRDRLVRWDVDASIDLYDARVDGGFPEPVAPKPQCIGDACQGLVSASPSVRLAGSSVFHGAGNLKAKKAKKRKVCTRRKVRPRGERQRRCVKKGWQAKALKRREFTR